MILVNKQPIIKLILMVKRREFKLCCHSGKRYAKLKGGTGKSMNHCCVHVVNSTNLFCACEI